ncbi:TPA: hypothetical protein U2C48_000177 [Streptococcus suis]|nr:hypothetical protein [Streptococcus suis]
MKVAILVDGGFYRKRVQKVFGDETTHYKAHPLPYESIRNTDDFLTVLSDLLGFTNISNPEEININIQEDLL